MERQVPEADSGIAGFARFLAPSAEEQAYLDSLTANRHRVPAHRQVISDGRSCDQIFLVVSGWLAAYKQLRDGGRQILGLRLAGDFVGLECFAYHVAPYAVATLTACVVAPIGRADIEDMLRRFPRLASSLVLAVSYNNALLQQFAVSLGRRDAFSRIAHLLTELTLRIHATGADTAIPLTQQDIADCTGLTTPYVNRILKRMREEDMVAIERHALRVCDLGALARSAGFRPEYLQICPNHDRRDQPRADTVRVHAQPGHPEPPRAT
jgi:CRP-like cAMP-binding protein